MSLNQTRNILLAGSALMLSACATIPPPQYSIEHPANPDAESAPIEPKSNSLASYRPAGASLQTEPIEQGKPADAHTGHGAHSPSQPKEETGHDRR